MTFKPLYKKNTINRGKICKEPGCNRLARIKGLCVNCYNRMRKDNEEN